MKAKDKRGDQPPTPTGEEAPGAGEPEAADQAASEPDQPVAAAEAVEDPVRVVEQDLEKWRELAMRTSADLDNYRKRMARDREEAVRYANQSLIEELLPVLDNFEMGMEAAAAEEGSMIYVGMQMVQRQFADWLAAQGVARIDVEAGTEFDPEVHEAMSQEPSGEMQAGRILRVTRSGYRLRDRLLRPATVVVSSGAPSGDPQCEG